MNRKQKIIVSITGIFLVLMILVGLTYAYFLTRIQGNTNDKSISVTTANLELTYSDNSDVITGTNIVPGTTLGTKTFTVTNNGNKDVDSYSVGLVNIINTFERLDDITYTLTCTSSITDSTCNGVEETSFPTLNTYIVNNSIKVKEVQTYTITVTYKEMGVDQSVDMNKELSAKIDIFDTNSLTIQGSVTNSSSNDYVVIQSKEQESSIVDGKYKFIGITSDTHTISVKNRRTSSVVKTKLDVEKGTPSVSSNKIVYSNEKNVADMNISVSTSTIAIDVSKISGGITYFKDVILASAQTALSTSDTTRTIYQETPTTTPGQAVSTETEKTLSKTEDDDGDSYYYRGNVVDNFVNYAGMCWRIVRIQGDGSVKLILEDQNTTCENSEYTGNWNIGTRNFGYTTSLSDLNLVSNNEEKYEIWFLSSFGFTYYYENYLNSTDSTAMVNNFKNFQSNKLTNYLNYLKAGDWCLDDTAYNDTVGTTKLSNSDKYNYYSNRTSFYYDSYVRLVGKETKEPTLKCNGTVMTKFADNTDMYVGTLTADEIVYAGGIYNTSNSNYYLINDYQKSNSLYFWSLSPYCFDSDSDLAFVVYYDGLVRSRNVNYNYGVSFRPAVSLKSSTQITGGNGTKANAYTILIN